MGCGSTRSFDRGTPPAANVCADSASALAEGKVRTHGTRQTHRQTRTHAHTRSCAGTRKRTFTRTCTRKQASKDA
eukprot:3172614-Pleurochrysis_carterae.AAC.1